MWLIGCLIVAGVITLIAFMTWVVFPKSPVFKERKDRVIQQGFLTSLQKEGATMENLARILTWISYFSIGFFTGFSLKEWLIENYDPKSVVATSLLTAILAMGMAGICLKILIRRQLSMNAQIRRTSFPSNVITFFKSKGRTTM